MKKNLFNGEFTRQISESNIAKSLDIIENFKNGSFKFKFNFTFHIKPAGLLSKPKKTFADITGTSKHEVRLPCMFPYSRFC